MNQELRQKIAQIIIEKECLFQIYDEEKKDYATYNISAFITEMLEENKQFVSDCLNLNDDIKLYSYEEFDIISTYELYEQMIELYKAQTDSSNIRDYYAKNIMVFSKLLTDEQNETN